MKKLDVNRAFVCFMTGEWTWKTWDSADVLYLQLFQTSLCVGWNIFEQSLKEYFPNKEFKTKDFCGENLEQLQHRFLRKTHREPPTWSYFKRLMGEEMFNLIMLNPPTESEWIINNKLTEKFNEKNNKKGSFVRTRKPSTV